MVEFFRGKAAPSEEGPKDPSRRRFMKQAASAGAVGAAGLTAGGTALQHENRERTRRVAELATFLQGKAESDEVITLTVRDEQGMTHEQPFTYDNLVILTQALLQDTHEKTFSTAATRKLLEATAYVVQTEDEVGGTLNTNPNFEALDQILESALPYKLPLASSFGFGQLNPRTAKNFALRYQDGLLKHNLLSEGDVEKLSNAHISDQEIVSILGLSGYDHDNVLYSLFHLYEAYEVYGTVDGQLQTGRLTDSRYLTLAMTAYGGGLEAPAVAKLQTYLNELLLADTKLADKRDYLLPVDGDPGPNTLKTLALLLNHYEIDVSDLELSRLSLQETFTLIERLEEKWRSRKNILLGPEEDGKEKSDTTLETIIDLASRRYKAGLEVYLEVLQLCDEAGLHEQREWTKTMFLAFIENRDPRFFDQLKNRSAFSLAYREVGEEKIDSFYAQLPMIVSTAIDYDESYKGYVPTHFTSSWLGDDKNAASKSILLHEIRTGSTATTSSFA